jgi:AcrR family transcriptional regulator
MVGIPNRDRRAERREATRQEIISAAWDVARANGPAGLTLREVAVRVGMQPPSLYSHFESKNAIYDAMFAQAWRQFMDRIAEIEPRLPADPRARLLLAATTYFDFAVEDGARHQLMSERPLPDFTPSAEAYQPAVECFERMRGFLTDLGVTRAPDIDLYTALLTGLVSQQLANDPGGTRWRALLPGAIEMYADRVGVPARRRPTRRKT